MTRLSLPIDGAHLGLRFDLRPQPKLPLAALNEQLYTTAGPDQTALHSTRRCLNGRVVTGCCSCATSTADGPMRLMLTCVMMLTATPGKADILRPATVCSAAMAAMEVQPYGVNQFVADLLEEADRSFARQQRGSMMADLSDDGLRRLVALVIRRCSKYPSRTVKLVAASVYLDVRQLQADGGLKR